MTKEELYNIRKYSFCWRLLRKYAKEKEDGGLSYDLDVLEKEVDENFKDQITRAIEKDLGEL